MGDVVSMTGKIEPPSLVETLELQIRLMSAYLNLKAPGWRQDLSAALEREYVALESAR